MRPTLEKLMEALPLQSFMDPPGSSYYDEEYFTKGTKSNYCPYGPGDWAANLARMIVDYLKPSSVLDVGCAYGYVVKELLERGVDAYGFDISEYAIKNSVVGDRIWVGYAEDGRFWRFVDLVVCTETLEHFVWYQIKKFFVNAQRYADRILALIATYKAVGDIDKSHITLMPMSWWIDLASCFDFVVDEESTKKLNEDPYSSLMGWSGRFVVWNKSL